MNNTPAISNGNSHLVTARATAAVAICSVIFGRSLAQALPGSSSGLGRILEINRIASGFFTQLLAIMLVASATRLIGHAWAAHGVAPRYRLFIAPAAVAVVTIVILASLDTVVGPYTPEISILLGVMGGTVALNSAAACTKLPPLRVAGLSLWLIGVASIGQILSRLFALQASEAAHQGQFAAAQFVATAAVVLDALSIAVVFVWVVRRDRVPWYRLLTAVAACFVLVNTAHRGASSGANTLQVVLWRSLAQLHREPSPVLPQMALDSIEVMALLLALVLLFYPRRASVELRACLGLIVLARSSTDIPLCAGMLVVGALGLSALATAGTPDLSAVGPLEISDASTRLEVRDSH